MQDVMDVDSQDDPRGTLVSSSGNSIPTNFPDSVLQHGPGMLQTSQARPRTAYIYDPVMMNHRPGALASDPNHPEAPGRIKAIFDILVDNLLIPRMLPLTSRWATKSEILLIHSEEHWEKVEKLKGTTMDRVILYA